MRLKVDEQADALYLSLGDGPASRSDEVSPGIIVDYVPDHLTPDRLHEVEHTSDAASDTRRGRGPSRRSSARRSEWLPIGLLPGRKSRWQRA